MKLRMRKAWHASSRCRKMKYGAKLGGFLFPLWAGDERYYCINHNRKRLNAPMELDLNMTLLKPPISQILAHHCTMFCTVPSTFGNLRTTIRLVFRYEKNKLWHCYEVL